MQLVSLSGQVGHRVGLEEETPQAMQDRPALEQLDITHGVVSGAGHHIGPRSDALAGERGDDRRRFPLGRPLIVTVKGHHDGIRVCPSLPHRRQNRVRVGGGERSRVLFRLCQPGEPPTSRDVQVAKWKA
jgi:hypothetical protein